MQGRGVIWMMWCFAKSPSLIIFTWSLWTVFQDIKKIECILNRTPYKQTKIWTCKLFFSHKVSTLFFVRWKIRTLINLNSLNFLLKKQMPFPRAFVRIEPKKAQLKLDSLIISVLTKPLEFFQSYMHAERKYFPPKWPRTFFFLPWAYCPHKYLNFSNSCC